MRIHDDDVFDGDLDDVFDDGHDECCARMAIHTGCQACGFGQWFGQFFAQPFAGGVFADAVLPMVESASIASLAPAPVPPAVA